MKQLPYLSSKILIPVTALCLAVTAAKGQSVYWTGQGATSNWSDIGNWDPAVPLSNEDIKFAETNGHDTNVNDLNSPAVGYTAASLEFTAAGPAANLSGATVDADGYTLTGNPFAFFNAGSANTITNNSPNLQTLSFADGGFGGIDVFVPNVTIIANTANFLITSTIALNAGTVTFDGAANTTVTGEIYSQFTPEGIIKNGTGTLELDSLNTYSGPTAINNGTLIAGNTFALGSGDVNLNGGTLRTPEGTPVTIFIGGPAFNPSNLNANGGTLLTQVGGTAAGQSDLFAPFGNANLDPVNSGLFVHRINGYNPNNGDTVLIIETPFGTVNGQFGNAPQGSVAPNDFVGLIQPFADYTTGGEVNLIFGFAQSFASIGKTPNQIATGAALDAAVAAGCIVPATNVLGNVPINTLRHAYDLIAPEELASIYEASFSQSMEQSLNIQRRLDDIRWGATGFCNEGFAITDNHGYSKDDKSVADKNPVEQTAPPNYNWGSFITGTGELSKVGDEDANGDHHGYQLNNASFTMGADYRFGDSFALGIAGGYTHTTAELVDDGRMNTDGGRIGLYGTWYADGFYVDASAMGGWNQYDTRRTAYLGTEQGSTNGAEFDGMVAGGYDWKRGCWLVGPIASFEYSYAEFDAFTEGDTSLIPLHYPDQNENAYRSNLGFRIAHQQNYKPGEGLNVVPEVRVAWRHDFGPTSYAIDSNFVGCDDTFTVHGPYTGRDSAVVNIGLTAYCTQQLSAYINYDGQFGRDNYNNNGISGGLRYDF